MNDKNRHISQDFEQRILRLQEEVMVMGGIARLNLDRAMQGLRDRDIDLCKIAIADDTEVDEAERRIDALGLEILARFHPVASDLRLVLSSMRIAQDKGYSGFFLKSHGFHVPETAVFLQDAWAARIGAAENTDAARTFAERLGWLVFLKPVRGSGGAGIVRTVSKAEYETLAPGIFATQKKVLMQEACAGRDYRLVVLDGEVISAYERQALTVVGDGSRTITDLLAIKQGEFDEIGRDTIIPLGDPRIAQVLQREGLSPTSVIPAGTCRALLDVANLSCGGTTLDVTADLHPGIAALAARIAAAMDLRFAGVDILLKAHDAPPEDYRVLEVNSAPGLDHYATSGAAQEAHVDALYLKVLQAIERGP